MQPIHTCQGGPAWKGARDLPQSRCDPLFSTFQHAMFALTIMPHLFPSCCNCHAPFSPMASMKVSSPRLQCLQQQQHHGDFASQLGTSNYIDRQRHASYSYYLPPPPFPLTPHRPRCPAIVASSLPFSPPPAAVGPFRLCGAPSAPPQPPPLL